MKKQKYFEKIIKEKEKQIERYKKKKKRKRKILGVNK